MAKFKLAAILVFTALVLIVYNYLPISRQIKIVPASQQGDGVKIASSESREQTPAGITETSQSRGIRIMTYNIHSGLDGDLKEIAAFIKDMDVDILALQEVDRFQPRSNYANQGETLAGLLNMHYVYGPNIRLGPAQYGNAILSRFPIIEGINHTLPSGREPRGILETKILIDGEIFSLFNTHLAISDKERIKQAEFINNLLKNVQGNTVLTGDFNDIPESETIQIIKENLNDLWEIKGKGPGYTFPSWNPGVRIDYIFAGNRIKINSIEVISVDLSDHLPVLADIELLRKGE